MLDVCVSTFAELAGQCAALLTEPAEREQIFRRFTRVGGAWLGLSLARRVIEAHCGTMGVEANAGGGNTYWFTLPV